MAKALMGYLGGSDRQLSVLASENAALRARVAALLSQVEELSESLSAATAVADGRLVDLVAGSTATELDVTLHEVPAGARV
jgi:hypothetical protein